MGAVGGSHGELRGAGRTGSDEIVRDAVGDCRCPFRTVAGIIKRLDPEATVLAGSTAMVPLGFFKGLLQSEGADSFDYCSLHSYGAVPEQAGGAVRQLQQLLRGRGKSPVLWQTECGFPSSGDTAGWGFVFMRDTAFTYGHSLLAAGRDQSAMFPTWFRTLTLAYLGRALPDSPVGKFPWRLGRCPGLQFWKSTAPRPGGLDWRRGGGGADEAGLKAHPAGLSKDNVRMREF